MSQIALPLSVAAPDRPVRIVVGEGNRAAVAALTDPSDWPFRTAVLVGPPRSGKSLLARWFAASGKGEAVDGADRWDETALFGMGQDQLARHRIVRRADRELERPAEARAQIG